jgi:Zn-dependent M32 family carboxypeptidase
MFAAVHESGHGTFETSTDVRYKAAFVGNADITNDCRTITVYEYTP